MYFPRGSDENKSAFGKWLGSEKGARDGLFYWHIYASFGLVELICLALLAPCGLNNHGSLLEIIAGDDIDCEK